VLRPIAPGLLRVPRKPHALSVTHFCPELRYTISGKPLVSHILAQLRPRSRPMGLMDHTPDPIAARSSGGCRAHRSLVQSHVVDLGTAKYATGIWMGAGRKFRYFAGDSHPVRAKSPARGVARPPLDNA
jgi:hypothetical protein